MSEYKWYSLSYSLEQSISNFIGIASGIIIFVSADYANTGLDTAKIFSCLEIIFTFKYMIVLFAKGIGFYYEMQVILVRFATIFNIKEHTMLQIHPSTK